MLEVRELTKAFDGFTAVSRVSFDVPKGSVSAIIGPNGAGKTTLFNLITGHLRADTGRVVLNGRDVTGVPPHELCRIGVGRSFQRTNIFAKLTVYENVQAAFVSHRGRGWNVFTPVRDLYRDETLRLLRDYFVDRAVVQDRIRWRFCIAPAPSSSAPGKRRHGYAVE